MWVQILLYVQKLREDVKTYKRKLVGTYRDNTI